MSRRSLVVTAALAVALSSAVAGRAAVLVNDTWKDDTDSDPASPTFSEAGTDLDSDGDLESAWFQGGVGSLDPVAGGGPGPLRADLTAGGTSSATWTTYFTPEGSEVNLADGQQLKVTWVFSLTNVGANNTSQNFRFALVDSSARSTANGSLPASVYAGYAVFANMSSGVLGNSNPFQLRERTNAVSGNLLNNSSDFNTVLGNGATTGNTGYSASIDYTMVWSLKRSGTSLDIDVSIKGGSLDGDGTAQVIVNDASPNSFKYDTFGIRPSGATTSAELIDTKLFKVETIVPEPATASMMALAALGGLGLRRRR